MTNNQTATTSTQELAVKMLLDTIENVAEQSIAKYNADQTAITLSVIEECTTSGAFLTDEEFSLIVEILSAPTVKQTTSLNGTIVRAA